MKTISEVLNKIGMTDKEYRAIDLPSITRLLRLKNGSMADYNKEVKTTPNMEFGTAFHKWFLEKSTFGDDYITEDKILIEGEPINRRKKAHREFLETLPQKILSVEDLIKIERMEQSIKQNPDYFDISEWKSEQIIFWFFEEVKIKSKIDIIGDNFIADLKTIQSGIIGDDRRLYYKILDSNYHLQILAYALAVEQETNKLPKTCYLIFAETSEPFNSRIVELDTDKLLDNYYHELQDIIQKYKEVKELNFSENYFDKMIFFKEEK